MQKYLASLIIAILLLAQSATALAQSTTTSTSGETTAFSITTEPLVPALISPLPAESQTRIINLAANMSNRADALVLRLENITARVESRIVKMEAEGHDTTDARNYLAQAKQALVEAKAHINGVDGKVNAFVTAQNYWTGWMLIRDTYAETETVLDRSKRALLSAVEDMKLSLQDAEFIRIYGNVPLPTSTNPTAN